MHIEANYEEEVVSQEFASRDCGEYSSLEAGEISMMPMPPTLGAEVTLVAADED